MIELSNDHFENYKKRKRESPTLDSNQKSNKKVKIEISDDDFGDDFVDVDNEILSDDELQNEDFDFPDFFDQSSNNNNNNNTNNNNIKSDNINKNKINNQNDNINNNNNNNNNNNDKNINNNEPIEKISVRVIIYKLLLIILSYYSLSLFH